MKKIEVLKNGETKLHEVEMNAKQKRDYAMKVSSCLSKMLAKWDDYSVHHRQHPTFEGIYKASTHIVEVLNTEEDIPMKFAFTKPEQCAIYFAFCFGAFDCLDFVQITNTSREAVTMLKVLTSRKARNQVLEG